MARLAHWLIAALYTVTLVGLAALFFGCVSNDHTIAQNRETVVGTVVSTSWWRTTVEFQDTQALTRVPPRGVLYPGGVNTGQSVLLEYDRNNPDLVKIAGRSATLAVLPVASSALVATVVAALLWVGSTKLAARQAKRKQLRQRKITIQLYPETDQT